MFEDILTSWCIVLLLSVVSQELRKRGMWHTPSWKAGPSLCLVPLQCCIRKRRIFFLCGVETLKKALKILKGLISGFKGALWGGGSDLL